MKTTLNLLAIATVSFATLSFADTSDVKGPEAVTVSKSGAHCADDANCFNRYHPSIKPAATAKPGQHIVFETRADPVNMPSRCLSRASRMAYYRSQCQRTIRQRFDDFDHVLLSLRRIARSIHSLTRHSPL